MKTKTAPLKVSYFFIIFLFMVSSFSIQAAQKKSGNTDENPLSELSMNALKFRELGPALMSGRISDFAVNPEDRSEYYVAVSSGGVWKTINAGTTFEPIFDSEGSYSIGCVTMDPNNHHVIWVGTGENNNQRSVGYGDGVYKSVDGGKSWTNVGLKQSEHIGMIAVDPRDSDVVYVAAYGPLWSAAGDRGLYKSTDGGKNWAPVLTISEHTGISEVYLDPRNPEWIYTVAHQRRRHVWTVIDGGPESAIHKSTDGGATWKKTNKGLPSGDLGRIGLAISPVNPDVLYAIVEAQGEKGGFYRSTDRGETWERRNDYTARGNYYQEIFCDPMDVDRVYSMDVRIQVTDDGGKTFRNLGERHKHGDNHAMWIDPDHPDYYLVGSDGGVYESFDRGQTWKFMPNLPITQFYKVAVDNDSPFYNVYGGTQDNNSQGGPSRTTSAQGITNEDWFITMGGDGYESQIDPEDPNIVYAQMQYGGLVRFDKKSGERIGIQPKPRKGEKEYRWNWDSPLLISPHSHTRLYFAANKVFRSDDRGNTWEVLSDDLSRQLDRNKLEVMGRVWPMDAVAKNASTSQYGNIVALDESPLVEGLLYAGTDDGLIQVLEPGSEGWRRMEKFPGVPDMTYVNEVLASQHETDTVYAAFNNHKRGDFKPYVLKSTDRGRTWTGIASNLPERGSVYALDEDHVNKDLLFAGTEFGCFFSIDGGTYWKRLKAGLPTIAVRDIAIQKRENDLVLGTFGRGFLVLDDYSALRELKNVVGQKEAHIFPVRKARMYVENSRLGSTRAGSKATQGENFFTAANPLFGTTFTYYLKDKIETLEEKRENSEKELVKADKPVPYPTYEEMKTEMNQKKPFLIFTILDEDDAFVRELRAPFSQGLHRITWDLCYPQLGSTSTREEDPAKTGPSSTLVLPGTYKIYLSKSVDGEITKLTEPVSFEVESLANTSLPAEDRAELVGFQKKVRRLSSAVNAAAQGLRELGDKVKHYRVALKSVSSTNVELNSAIDSMESSINALRTRMFGDSVLLKIDKDAEPGLSTRINTIIYEQRLSTSAPTTTQRQAYKIVSDEFEAILAELKRLTEVDSKKIEDRLKELGAPYTPGRFSEWKK